MRKTRATFHEMKKFLLLAFLALSSRALALDETADAAAKFLAGLPVHGTPLESYSLDPAWASHATELDQAWTRFDQLQLAKIRAWAPQFMGDAYTDTAPMFYMFSGPDFLYANVLFPQASVYILCGTEPVGPIPDIAAIPREALPSALANLRKSLDSLLSWSFFVTKNMKIDLAQKQLSGTLPVIYVFLARAGYTIDSVAPVALDRSGNLTDSGKGKTPGVKIVFSGANAISQTLYYFTSNLENDAIKANPGFMKFCQRQGQGLTLLKASSYLMFQNNFSIVRDFLLTHSKIIVQDDSGIPYRFFDPAKWQIRYCGNYVGPIDLFKQYPQPDLARDYSLVPPAPLEFSFGYRWQPTRASLIIATPRLQ
jgi:hypothetical protein